MLNTYLYFSEDGTLKEQIQTPVRAGGTNSNAIFVYWEGVSNAVTGFTIDYKGGATGVVFDNHYVPSVDPDNPNENCIIPYNPKRDLKFFKYYTQYEFYVFNIPNTLLAGDPHPIAFNNKVVYTDNGVSVDLPLQLCALWCEGQAIKEDQLITIAQWNELTTLLGQYITAAEVANLYVTKINPTSSGLMTHTGDGYFTGDLGTNGDLIVNQDFKIEKDGSDFKVSVDGGDLIYEGSEVANKEYVDDNILDMTSNPMTLTDEQYAYASMANVRVRQTLPNGDKKIFDKAYETSASYLFVCSRDEQITPSNQDYKQRNLSVAMLTKATKVLATGVMTYNFYDKSQTDVKFAHSFSASVDTTTYVMTMVLKDANGNTLSSVNVDLPLESIIVSAQYYATYTYEGTTYNNVIVITLATTSVPTIIPLGTLVSGLVDLTSNQVITGYKTFKYKITWQSPNGTKSSELRQADAGNFDFYLNGSVKLRYSYTNNNWDCFLDFVPHSDNTYDLGGSNNFWKDLYLKGYLKDGTNAITIAQMVAKANDSDVVHLAGTETITGNKTFTGVPYFQNGFGVGTNATFYGNLVPLTNNYYDLGSSSKLLKDLYLKGYLKDGTNSLSLQNIVDFQATVNEKLTQLFEAVIFESTLSYSFLQWSAIPNNISSYPIVFSGGMEMTNVKGNSAVVNQLAKELTSSYWTYSNMTNVSFNSGVASFTATAYGGTFYPNTSQPDLRHVEANHKYLLFVNIKTASATNQIRVRFDSAGASQDTNTVASTNWQTVCAIKSASTGQSTSIVIQIMDGRSSDWDEIQIKDVQVIDLTTMGLDSLTTVDEVRSALLSRGINIDEYNAYNEGSLKDSQATGYAIKHFNLWDEEWELGGIDTGGNLEPRNDQIRSKNFIQVAPLTTYYFKCIARVCQYDKDYNFIKANAINNSTITMVGNTKYVKFRVAGTTTYDGDICINISVASLNGTYKPYQAPTSASLTLPVMRGVGTAQDDKDYIKVGVVELSKLNWARLQVDNDFYVFNVDNLSPVAPNNVFFKNFIYNSAKYNKWQTWSWTTFPDLTIGVENKRIRIRDDSYTDVATFKNSLQGVYLYYELQTPFDRKDMKEVDLGSLSWTLRSTGTNNKAWSATLPSPYLANANNKLNWISDKTYQGNTTGTIIETNGADSLNKGVYAFDTTAGTSTSTVYMITGVNETPSGTLYYELATPLTENPIVLPSDLVIEKGDSVEITYDSTNNVASDFDFAVATSKIKES